MVAHPRNPRAIRSNSDKSSRSRLLSAERPGCFSSSCTSLCRRRKALTEASKIARYFPVSSQSRIALDDADDLAYSPMYHFNFCSLSDAAFLAGIASFFLNLNCHRFLAS